jgi:hypothetical protein
VSSRTWPGRGRVVVLAWPGQSPTLGFTHLQFEALPHPNKAHVAWGRRAHRLEPDR